mmetsp:Transcript_51681/g.160356  ORF Transcript_51681/g.160356 Transcript_51681/m.160356 type:complete len:253 (-) Transcript_51681:54-812(-)
MTATKMNGFHIFRKVPFGCKTGILVLVRRRAPGRWNCVAERCTSCREESAEPPDDELPPFDVSEILKPRGRLCPLPVAGTSDSSSVSSLPYGWRTAETSGCKSSLSGALALCGPRWDSGLSSLTNAAASCRCCAKGRPRDAMGGCACCPQSAMTAPRLLAFGAFARASVSISCSPSFSVDSTSSCCKSSSSVAAVTSDAAKRTGSNCTCWSARTLLALAVNTWAFGPPWVSSSCSSPPSARGPVGMRHGSFP